MRTLHFLRHLVEILSANSFAALDGIEASFDKRKADRATSEKFYVVRRAVSWEECCLQIANKHNLSPRETEVMQLLSVGRDAKRISEILVISVSTVKSHMYRIYRKLGITSQQSLIDLVENADRADMLKAAM